MTLRSSLFCNTVDTSFERIRDFCNLVPIQYFQFVVQSDPNPIAGLLSK